MKTSTLAILTPSRGKPTPEFLFALERNVEMLYYPGNIIGKPVDEARNALAEFVKALPDRPDYIAWADDDAYWFPGTVTRLMQTIDESKKPELTVIGVMQGGRYPHAPMTACKNRYAIPTPRIVGMRESRRIVECDQVGGHFFMHRIELLDALPANPFTVPVFSKTGEDFMFCDRVREIGGTILCDTTLPVFHCDEGFMFLPGMQPFEFNGGEPKLTSKPWRRPKDWVRRYGDAVEGATIRAIWDSRVMPGAKDYVDDLCQAGYRLPKGLMNGPTR